MRITTTASFVHIYTQYIAWWNKFRELRDDFELEDKENWKCTYISAVSPLCLPYQNVYYDLVENLSLKTYPRVCINHHPCRFYSRGYKSIKTFSRAKRKPQVLGALILFHFISRRHFHNNRNRGTVFSREIKWMRYEVKARLKFYTTD